MIETVEVSEDAYDVLRAYGVCSADLVNIALEQHKSLIDESQTIVSVFDHFNQAIVTLRYAEEGQQTEWYILSWSEFVGLGVTFGSFSLN